MKQQDYLKLFMDQSERTTAALENIRDSIKSINDTNALHCQVNSKFSADIDKLVKSSTNMEKVVSRVLWLAILALVVLAGAEKVLKFM